MKSVDDQQPRLIKLTENPQLSETLDYVIHEGCQVVGHWTPDATSDILLRGSLIAPSHWLVLTLSHLSFHSVDSPDTTLFLSVFF